MSKLLLQASKPPFCLRWPHHDLTMEPYLLEWLETTRGPAGSIPNSFSIALWFSSPTSLFILLSAFFVALCPFLTSDFQPQIKASSKKLGCQETRAQIDIFFYFTHNSTSVHILLRTQ